MYSLFQRTAVFIIFVLSYLFSWVLYAEVSHPLMGTGFDSLTHQIKKACLKGNVILTEKSSFSMDTSVGSRFEQSLGETNGFWELGINLGIIGGKGRTDFMIRNIETDRKSTLVSQMNMTKYEMHFSDYQVLPEIHRIKADKQLLSDECGNAFINRLTLGKSFYLASSLIFPSKESLKEFKTTITISAFFGLIKKQKIFTKTFKDYAGDAILQIRFIQIGGSQTALDELSEKNPKYCDKDSIQKCLDFYQAVNAYVSSDSFIDLGKMDDQVELLYPVEISGIDYRFSKAHELASNSVYATRYDRGIDSKIKAMADIYAKIEGLEQKLYLDELSSVEREAVQSELRELDKAAESSKKSFYTCFESPSEACLL